MPDRSPGGQPSSFRWSITFGIGTRQPTFRVGLSSALFLAEFLRRRRATRRRPGPGSQQFAPGSQTDILKICGINPANPICRAETVGGTGFPIGAVVVVLAQTAAEILRKVQQKQIDDEYERRQAEADRELERRRKEKEWEKVRTTEPQLPPRPQLPESPADRDRDVLPDVIAPQRVPIRLPSGEPARVPLEIPQPEPMPVPRPEPPTLPRPAPAPARIPGPIWPGSPAPTARPAIVTQAISRIAFDQAMQVGTQPLTQVQQSALSSPTTRGSVSVAPSQFASPQFVTQPMPQVGPQKCAPCPRTKQRCERKKKKARAKCYKGLFVQRTRGQKETKWAEVDCKTGREK